VAVVAADMPFAAALLPDLVDELSSAPDDVDAIIPTDADGREQPLAAVYRTDALRSAAASLGGVENRSVRDLRSALRARLHPVESAVTLLDVDTPDDLAAARRSVPSTRES
jgi:molybdopterin-guanine dinucleotide biosynthesis protein A